MVRPRFNPSADFVAARSFTYAGTPYEAGQPFDKSGIAPHRLSMLYGSRAINVGETAADPVQLRQTRPGYFEITAPWLDEPEKVRGKANAEKRLAEIREEGEPLDHHGVSVNESGGGWYSVETEWGVSENVQGLDEAKARATQLRAEGPPPEHYALVVVAPVDENEPDGSQTVDAPWLDHVETYATKDEAEARAIVIREAGPPAEGYDADAIQKAREERTAEETRVREEAAANARTARRQQAWAERFTIASETTGEGEEKVTTYRVEGPSLDKPEEFDAEDKAEARLTELRESSPPEDWEPTNE